MKYVKQALIILLISFIGEALHALLPLPVPASIYGIVILFVCLKTGVIKLSAVKDTADFLIDILPIMFIPAAVGLIDTFVLVKSLWWQYLIVIFVSTVLVLFVSGKVTQAFGKKKAALNAISDGESDDNCKNGESSDKNDQKEEEQDV